MVNRKKADVIKIKNVIPEVLAKHMGNISAMCKELGIARTTFYRYINDDPEFMARCKEVEEQMLDFAESCLFKSMKDGNVTAIIFYLKTKGKQRGFVENPAFNLNVAENITEVVINVKGRE